MTCSFASKDMFSCEDGLCTGEVGLVELKIAGGIQYPRLRGGNNRHKQCITNTRTIWQSNELYQGWKLDFLNSVKSSLLSITVPLKKCVQKDKVNYAVSEKGQGETMLTCIMGWTGMYCAVTWLTDKRTDRGKWNISLYDMHLNNIWFLWTKP